DAARRAGIPTSVCGEMASDPLSAVFLIGAGYTRLSVAPPSLPMIRYVVRMLPAAACEAAAARALAAPSAEAATQALRETAREYLDLRLFDPQATLPGRVRPASLPTHP
ncbi:MAG: putative PEP-binding protein, partial [Gemmatimonadota bacterium]